jgi:hypothetical protein
VLTSRKSPPGPIVLWECEIAIFYTGLGSAPRKLLQEERELRSLDVLLSGREKTIRLRMGATSVKELKVLLYRMNILVPNRSKVIGNVVEKM